MEEEEILAALKAHVAREQDTRATDPAASQAVVANSKPTVQQLTDPSHVGEPPGQRAFDRYNSSIDRSRIANASAAVSQLQNAVGQLNPRNSGVSNWIAQTIKKIVQRSLSWYTRSLQTFNRGVAEAFEVQGGALNSIQDQIVAIRNQLMSDEHRLGSIDANLLSIQRQLQQFKNDLPATIELHLRTMNGRLPEALAVAELARQEQQSPYLPLFQGSSPVVDIGCGRGEFLELLKEAGITAYGVDSDPVACEAARGKALKIVEGDLFEHLRQLPNRYLGGVFSARVVEYLPAHLLAEFITLCSEKMKARGIIVIETANPAADSSFGHTYRIDPSHFRAVYPEVLKSILDSKGFVDSKVCFLAPKEVSLTGVTQSKEGTSDKQASEQSFPPNASESTLRPRTYAVIARLQ